MKPDTLPVCHENVTELSQLRKCMKLLPKFWSLVAFSENCWMWSGSRSSTGYGLFYSSFVVSRYAHRFIYQMLNGLVLPWSTVVRHKCDNPCCVRPDHLEHGSFADNSADMVARGRSTKGRPRCLRPL